MSGRTQLGLADESRGGFSVDLMMGVEAAATELGWRHARVGTAAEESAADVVLAIGDVRLFPDLLRRLKRARRVLWHGETLPRPTSESGAAIHRALPTGRLLDWTFAAVPRADRLPRLLRLREQAAIVREPLANLRLLEKYADRFDRIVIDSADRAEGAIRAGLPVDVVPYGYHEAYAGALVAGGERPVQALVLAHLVGRHGRRQRWMTLVERQLGERGIALEPYPTGTYGVKRTERLRQTRVVVDIHRMPGNFPGFRFIVASAAGSALVTEPLTRPEPLVPGVHYLEAPADRMADAVAGLLADEPARQRLVEASQALLADQLHMRTVLPRALGTLRP
jgi:hypothetical protein